MRKWKVYPQKILALAKRVFMEHSGENFYKGF